MAEAERQGSGSAASHPPLLGCPLLLRAPNCAAAVGRVHGAAPEGGLDSSAWSRAGAAGQRQSEVHGQAGGPAAMRSCDGCISIATSISISHACMGRDDG